jgi:hypothetical protein
MKIQLVVNDIMVYQVMGETPETKLKAIELIIDELKLMKSTELLKLSKIGET